MATMILPSFSTHQPGALPRLLAMEAEEEMRLACLMLGEQTALVSTEGFRISSLLAFRDALRSLQWSGGAADEVQNAAQDNLRAMDFFFDTGDVSNQYAPSLDAWGDACLAKYLEEFLRGYGDPTT